MDGKANVKFLTIGTFKTAELLMEAFEKFYEENEIDSSYNYPIDTCIYEGFCNCYFGDVWNGSDIIEATKTFCDTYKTCARVDIWTEYDDFQVPETSFYGPEHEIEKVSIMDQRRDLDSMMGKTNEIKEYIRNIGISAEEQKTARKMLNDLHAYLRDAIAKNPLS